ARQGLLARRKGRANRKRRPGPKARTSRKRKQSRSVRANRGPPPRQEAPASNSDFSPTPARALLAPTSRWFDRPDVRTQWLAAASAPRWHRATGLDRRGAV